MFAVKGAVTAILSLGLVMAGAQPASATARVAIAGNVAVGSTLTAQVTGGVLRGLEWKGCDVKPVVRRCASGWRTLSTQGTYTPDREGMFLRADARVRLSNGRTTTVSSSIVGPVRKGTPGGGDGSGGGPKVGLYQCFSGAGAPPTFVSILPGSRYLGPYTTRKSIPSRFRVLGGATYPGGKVLDLIDGPYANLPDLALEYYAPGTSPYGTVYEVPVLHIIDPQEDFTFGCSWIRSNPYLGD